MQSKCSWLAWYFIQIFVSLPCLRKLLGVEKSLQINEKYMKNTQAFHMPCKRTTRTVAYLIFAFLTILQIDLGLFLHVCSTEEILREIRAARFTISRQKEMALSREVAEEFYKQHRDMLFFNQLVDYMCRWDQIPGFINSTFICFTCALRNRLVWFPRYSA